MDVAHCFLDGNADAVEFCTHEEYHNVLAVSAYTLQESDGQPTRVGSISLFNVNSEKESLELLERVDTAGIFDIKWSSILCDVGPLLAQADAEGYLRIYNLKRCSDGEEASGSCLLKMVAGEKISRAMCLFLDWNPSATMITVGLSDGSVSINCVSESKIRTLQEWKAHEFELWTTCFDIQQPQLLYTGSDDCKFSCWDLRDGSSSSVFQNSKAHKMGVCCIAKSPTDPNMLLTGSYDEHLRVWDVRSISKPINETCLGGGVWRIKHHPVLPGVVLAACMHNGIGIAKIKGGETEVVETYGKHGSLAYGADWQREQFCGQDKVKSSTVVATCSFYDRLVRVWRPESKLNCLQL